MIVAETHSDYMIDRVRIDVRDGKISPEQVAILYFEQKGTFVEAHQLSLDEAGNILNPPPCYREFFLNEQRALIGY
jgi:predicted ATPase